jgi:two-component system, LytTR family, response regulator
MTGRVIRTLIVDDEPLARRGIRARLARHQDIEIVGEAGDGDAAVELIHELRPDLVFLDVQMPERDGFGVITAVGADRMPPVIFVTAFDQHAIRAFEAEALDYLLKPIDTAQFERAIARARRQLEDHDATVLGRRLAAMLAGFGSPSSQPGAVDRFLIRKGGKLILVPADEVHWIEAKGDYVKLHAAGATHLLRETMGNLAERLDPTRFARIHRSTIVNLTRIREFETHSNREYVIVLQDGTRLKLSRGYREDLDRILRGTLGDRL